MFKRLSVIIIIFLTCINLSAQDDPVLGQGMMALYFLPQLHVIANTPLPGWSVTTNGRDKVFLRDTTDSRKYRITNGEYFFFDWWFMPIKGLTLNAGVEITSDYADTYYQPVNMEHSIHNEYFKKFTEEELAEGLDVDKVLERIRFWKGKAEYKYKYIDARLSKGYGHVGWDNAGDMFGFYLEQWDVENYRRIGADSAPTVFEADWSLNFGGANLGKLSVAAGPEPMWGTSDAYYAKYTYKLGLWVPTVLFKHEKIEWGRDDETFWAVALTSKYYGMRNLPLEFGLLFQPFRVDEEYTVTTKTDPGSGLGTSDYYVGTEKTDYLDALGFKVSANTRLVPFFDKTTLTASYLGRVAGNVNKYDLVFDKKVRSYYAFQWQNIVQLPLEGPEVLIQEGTAETPGQVLTGPRDRNDPFWVNSLNREAYITSLVFTFDPTPGSWLFKYRPNILELWNLNENETSPFAFIMKYTLSYYPGATDLEPYKNSRNDWLWPGEYDITAERMPVTALGGVWPLSRPIHFVTMIGEFKFLSNGLIILIVNTGEQIATSALAYTKSTFSLIPYTKMFSSSLNVFKYPYFGSVEFGHNVWGPEYWYTQLGGVVDKMYKATFRYNLDKNNQFELQYCGFREIDNKYFLDKLGPFDEFRLSYRGKFGTKFGLY
ncbi:MAG: hypothetical protein KKH98_11045 [Spirochaetes bacterium]|nr:hypothetical protein [Spirochaetota bacterium]